MTNSKLSTEPRIAANLPYWKFFLALLLSPLGILLVGGDVMLHFLNADHYCVLTGFDKIWKREAKLSTD